MAELRLYAQRWVALTETGAVAGVGQTAEEARRAGQHLRPKERLDIAWVSPYPPYLPLPEWPLHLLRPLLPVDRVWIVGGSVRDLLLKRPVHDWDFVVAGQTLPLVHKIADALHGAFVVLDADRDTGRVVLPNPRTHRPITLDFATLRGLTLEDDLRLRDFTINAIALTFDGALIDPTAGQSDLNARQIRMAGPTAFQDDPGRLLRAIRQAGSLHFQIETDTRAAIRQEAGRLRQAATERLLAELQRIVQLGNSGPALQEAEALGLLEPLLPEIVALRTVQQSAPHVYADTWTHSLVALSAMEGLLRQIREFSAPIRGLPGPDWAWKQLRETLTPFLSALLPYLDEPLAVDLPRADLLKWAVLFHDIGKAETQTIDEKGRTHFYGHASQGADRTLDRLMDLRFPRKAAEFVSTLVRHHMRLIDLTQHHPTRRTIYRFYRDTGSAGVATVLLSLADALAVWNTTLEAARWRSTLNAAQQLLSAYFHQAQEIVNPPSLLTGHDLIALGCRPGPQIGRLLEALREAQAAGEIGDRETAEFFIRARLLPD